MESTKQDCHIDVSQYAHSIVTQLPASWSTETDAVRFAILEGVPIFMPRLIETSYGTTNAKQLSMEMFIPVPFFDNVRHRFESEGMRVAHHDTSTNCHSPASSFTVLCGEAARTACSLHKGKMDAACETINSPRVIQMTGERLARARVLLFEARIFKQEFDNAFKLETIKAMKMFEDFIDTQIEKASWFVKQGRQVQEMETLSVIKKRVLTAKDESDVMHETLDDALCIRGMTLLPTANMPALQSMVLIDGKRDMDRFRLMLHQYIADANGTRRYGKIHGALTSNSSATVTSLNCHADKFKNIECVRPFRTTSADLNCWTPDEPVTHVVVPCGHYLCRVCVKNYTKNGLGDLCPACELPRPVSVVELKMTTRPLNHPVGLPHWKESETDYCCDM